MKDNFKNRDQDILFTYFRAFEHQLKAIRNSARWKLGNGVIRLIERLLGRNPRSLALDHLEQMTSTYLAKIQSDQLEDNLTTLPQITKYSYQSKNHSYNAPSCALIVSDSDWRTAAQGDVFTALDLATSCEKILGWKCKLVGKDEALTDSFDIVISLLFEYDIRDLKSKGIKIAWVRSYAEYWLMRPWFTEYDIFLCSSIKILKYIQTLSSKPSFLFPIATNPSRFQQAEIKGELKSDYCFTGNNWNEGRLVEKWLKPKLIDYQFKVFGKGWKQHSTFGEFEKGQISYADMASVYASTRLVLDDSNESTRKWESVNSRVFDVLGSGKMLLTNNKFGVNNLFAHTVPTYSSSDELEQKINELLGSENEVQLFESIRQEVLANHTYDNRANTLSGIVEWKFGKKYRIAIKISATQAHKLEYWGDYHFAKSLGKVFRRWNHQVHIDAVPHWNKSNELDDVTIVLRGLKPYTPTNNGLHILWIISHPRDLTSEELDAYDRIFVASSSFGQQIKSITKVPVTTLLQCTDTELFYPQKSDVVMSYNNLYVANSRQVERTAVKFAKETGTTLDIIGQDWNGIAPAQWIKGEYLQNENLRLFYSNAKVVINDHWPEMKEHGFISNRIFDVLACGASLLTDKVAGLDELFGEAVHTYSNKEEFRKVTATNSIDSQNSSLREQVVKIIADQHSFENRADIILGIIHQAISSQ